MFSTSSDQDVLCRAKKAVPASAKTFFRLHTGTLPVKAWIEEKGLFAGLPTTCTLCANAESVEHILTEWSDAIFFGTSCRQR